MKMWQKVVVVTGLLLSAYLWGTADRPESTLGAFESANGSINSILSAIATEQVNYRSTNGKYFQVPVTHTVLPKELNNAPVNKDRRPENQSQTLRDLLGTDVPDNLPYAFYVTEYETPAGEKGYSVTFALEFGGKKYEKVVDTSVETGRTHDWREIKPLP